MIKDKRKLFVIKKYVMALSARDALRKESKIPVDDVWIDEDWKKGQSNQLASAIGFGVDSYQEE